MLVLVVLSLAVAAQASGRYYGGDYSAYPRYNEGALSSPAASYYYGSGYPSPSTYSPPPSPYYPLPYHQSYSPYYHSPSTVPSYYYPPSSYAPQYYHPPAYGPSWRMDSQRFYPGGAGYWPGRMMPHHGNVPDRRDIELGRLDRAMRLFLNYKLRNPWDTASIADGYRLFGPLVQRCHHWRPQPVGHARGMGPMMGNWMRPRPPPCSCRQRNPLRDPHFRRALSQMASPQEAPRPRPWSTSPKMAWSNPRAVDATPRPMNYY